jgi:Fe-S-cluster containining protein
MHYKIYQLASKDNPGLFLWEWEKYKLEPMLKAMNINPEPFYAIYDTISHQTLVFSWTIPGNSCPFLEKDYCGIYNTRPINCRAYPLGYDLANKKIQVMEECKHNDIEKNVIAKYKKLEELELEDLSQEDGFNQLFTFAKKSSEIPLFIRALFPNLEAAKVLYRGIAKPTTDILKDIDENKFGDLFRFLVNNGALPQDEYDSLWDHFIEKI